jgi:DNA-binding CsgD family transcriptional regulator
MDAETHSKLLGSLYDAAADSRLWEPFLHNLAESTDARSANLMMHSFGLDKYTIYCSWELDPEANRLYQEHYGAIDIWGQRGLSMLAGRVCNSEELSPLAELSTTEIYNDFLARFGIEHGLFGVAVNSGSRWASVGLYRDSTRSAFGNCELETLRFLAPHIQRAFELHFQFSQLRAQSAGLERALDMLPTGVIFFGTKGEVVLMNRSASVSVSERDGLLATRDGLRAERPAESSLLEKTILQAASTSSGKGLSACGTVMISRRSRPPLRLQISPIRNSVIQTSRSIAAVAFVNDPLRANRPTQEVLRLLYGLTPAECRVALLLGDGHAPRKIANMVGVTDNTVRSQIKSIFSKTGVRRQGELIRLLLNGSGPTINANIIM